MRTAVLLAAALCFGGSLPALAQTAYYVSPSGDDAAPGTSLAEAFRSFSRGIEALEAGDSLLVDDGVYREAYLVIDSLIATAERPTVIKSINPWGAKIEGVIYHAVLLKILACDYIEVEGFEVYHPGDTYDTDWAAGIEAFESHHVTFRDNYVRDCGCGGLSMRTGDYFTIERNVAAGNARHSIYNCSGISVLQPRQLDDAPGPHIVIRDNVTFGNECRVPFLPMGFSVPTDGNGIILDDFEQTHSYTTDGKQRPPYRALTLIEGNLSFGNGGAGIKSYETANVTFRNNTAYHNNEVLSEQGGGLFSEIGAEAVAGHITMTGNIAVKAFARPGNAVYFKPKPGEAGRAARLTANDNLIVGLANLTAASIDPAANTLRGEDEQSYARFVDPRDTVPEDFVFRSVDDFRQYFGLRQNSPAVGKGAYEGTAETDLPLAPDPVLVAEINSTPQPVAIDGKREGYYSSEPQPIRKSLNPRYNGALPTATWYGAYDDEALFLFVEASGLEADVEYLVEIDIADPTQRAARGEKDHLTVTVAQEVGALSSSVRDGQLRLPKLDGQTGTQVREGERLAAEVAIPWATIGGPGYQPGGQIEIDVEVSDRRHRGPVTRAGDEGSLVMGWRNGDIERQGEPAHFGRAILREVSPPPSIPQATSMSTTAWPLSRKLSGAISSPADLSASWRARWDDDALYVTVDVTDDVLLADDGDAWYQDDGVEVYLDLDNAKTFGGYDDDDRQVSIGIDGTVRVTKGPEVSGARATVRRTGTGYVAEVSLPWAGLGAEASAGKFIGLDVHVIDDDDGGSSDAKLSWYSEQDQAHDNARLFGTAALAQ